MYTKLGGRAPSFCAMAQLLPSAEELSGFDTIDEILEWSGMPSPARASFLAVLGQPANLRIFAGIPINVFKTMVEGWRVPTATPCYLLLLVQLPKAHLSHLVVLLLPPR